MNTITKKLGVIEVLIDMFGKNEVTQLSDELLESQERANNIMKNSSGVANENASKKASGKSGKGSIVEKVEVNIENIKFSDQMIQTYQQVKEGQEK